MHFVTLPSIVFASLLLNYPFEVHASIKGRNHQNKFRRLSKGSSSSSSSSEGSSSDDSILQCIIDDFVDPPAGIAAGDLVNGPCSVELKDDLISTAEIDALTLDATLGDVELDCNGYSIIGSFDSNAALRLRGAGSNTITIKNCKLIGFANGVSSLEDGGVNNNNPDGGGDFNVVIMNSGAVGNEGIGFELRKIGGSVELDTVGASGNGSAGIWITGPEDTGDDMNPGIDVILRNIFACGNIKSDLDDDENFNGVIDVNNDINIGPDVDLDTEESGDITADSLADRSDGAFSFQPDDCPEVRNLPECVDINGDQSIL